MKSRRIRAILKIKGYRKSKGRYVRDSICFKCNGTGTWSGWVSTGSYPDVETYYQEPITCPSCNGTGTVEDETFIELERN